MNRWIASVSALSVLAGVVPVVAQENEGASDIPEIIVTAEMIRRSQMLTGNSAVILTAKDIQDQAGLDTVRDVLETIPNITLVTGTGKAPTVRGVDGTGPAENANAFFAGSRARLNWRIDGRPASYNEVVFGDIGLWDINRIEVLRGPQSTLVGRNAIAGTVVVDTMDPAFVQEGAAQIAAGNYDQRRASAMINLPLVADSVALRLSADRYQRDSVTSYDSYEGVSDPGRVKSTALRGKLLFTAPSDPDLRLLVTGAHVDHRGPNGEIIVRPFADRRSNFPQQPVHEPRTNSLGMEAWIPLADGYKVEISTSYTDFRFLRRAVPNSSNARIDTDEYIAEPRLRYEAADGTSLVTGLYLYRARQKEFIEFITAQNFRDNTDTAAAYVEGLLPVSDTLDLTAGLRYEREERERNGGDAAGAIARINSDATYDVFLPKLGVTWHPDNQMTWGAQISRGYNAGGGGIAFAIPIVNYEYGPEYVWTAELFGRQKWADGKIRTTQNLFHSRYRNMQLPFDLTPENTHDEAFVVRNAPRVETSGAELGIEGAVVDGVTARAQLGLLRTRITHYPGSGLEGNDLLTAPDVTAGGSVEWRHGDLTASGALTYTGAYFTDVNNRLRGRTDGRMIADIQASYDLGRFRLYGSLKNLFDSRAALARYPGVVPTGGTGAESDYDSAVLVQPRTFMAGVKVTF